MAVMPSCEYRPTGRAVSPARAGPPPPLTVTLRVGSGPAVTQVQLSGLARRASDNLAKAPRSQGGPSLWPGCRQRPSVTVDFPMVRVTPIMMMISSWFNLKLPGPARAGSQDPGPGTAGSPPAARTARPVPSPHWHPGRASARPVTVRRSGGNLKIRPRQPPPGAARPGLCSCQCAGPGNGLR